MLTIISNVNWVPSWGRSRFSEVENWHDLWGYVQENVHKSISISLGTEF